MVAVYFVYIIIERFYSGRFDKFIILDILTDKRDRIKIMIVRVLLRMPKLSSRCLGSSR